MRPAPRPSRSSSGSRCSWVRAAGGTCRTRPARSATARSSTSGTWRCGSSRHRGRGRITWHSSWARVEDVIAGDLDGVRGARSILAPPDEAAWQRSVAALRSVAPGARWLPGHGDVVERLDGGRRRPEAAAMDDRADRPHDRWHRPGRSRDHRISPTRLTSDLPVGHRRSCSLAGVSGRRRLARLDRGKDDLRRPATRSSSSLGSGYLAVCAVADRCGAVPTGTRTRDRRLPMLVVGRRSC